MRSDYRTLHDVLHRRATTRARHRERAGELLFHIFLLGALCWYVWGGLILFEHSHHAARFYDGPVSIGMGAITYTAGWWVRFILTGWRGLL